MSSEKIYSGLISFDKVNVRRQPPEAKAAGLVPMSTIESVFVRYAKDAQTYTANLVEALRFKKASTAFKLT